MTLHKMMSGKPGKPRKNVPVCAIFLRISRDIFSELKKEKVKILTSICVVEIWPK
jgi:hypothetical protein